jgi:nitrous oxide reductase accessory protein NosL
MRNAAKCGTAMACVALAWLTIGAGEARGLALGEPAPAADVRMKNVDGREISIAEVAGTKGTLVLFMCNACPWVKAWRARIVAIGNRCRQEQIGMIAINSNDPGTVPEDDFPTMQKDAKTFRMRFPYVVDATSGVAAAFGATRTPEAFLFDAGGRLVYHGTIDDNAKEPGRVKARYLEDALRAVREGRAVAAAETKALGCSIKFRKP